MERSRVLTLIATLALLAGACGGSGGGTTPPPSPTPTPTPTPTGNPCATTAIEEEVGPSGPARIAPNPDKTKVIDGTPRWRVLDALWLNREAALRGVGVRARGLAAGRDAVDIGDIAVVQDQGDLILPPNQYDLRSLGLRFTRNGAGGYDVRRIDGDFRQALGTRLTLGDDDSSQRNVPFTFSFYGRGQTQAFVNSDGNITFEEEDRASTERNVARLLTGPPRIAPFLSDLDPTTGSGRVFVQAAADQYTVTWCNVRGFDLAQTTNAQVTLLPDGTIEMKYGTVTLADAVVGVSPGHTGQFTPVNLSDAGPTGGGAAALGERFADQGELDTVAATRRFYETHPDSYDQLVIWTDVPAIDDAFAYETTIANEVTGIGVDTFDASRDFGSAGRLRSLAVMDWLGKYPDDPTQKFLGENNTVSVLGQEVGHRWLAFMEFRDHNGQRSEQLLGRGAAHWSFFFDSNASVMEGNDIEDLGGGSFRTVGAVQRFSLLDQYAMGLVPESAVPPFFYVESPVNVSPSSTSESGPRVGVTFNGTRRDVLIQDIVAIHGPRRPTAAESARVHRQAFLYVVSAGRSLDGGQVTKLDRIRRQWETFFLQATDGRMRADTRLAQ
jgi:hypothetical protein